MFLSSFSSSDRTRERHFPTRVNLNDVENCIQSIRFVFCVACTVNALRVGLTEQQQGN